MPRKPDENSVRQRGFKLLEGLKNVKREYAIKLLMTEFSIDEPYAATIYASKRRLDKEAGYFITTYRILDVKDGKKVTPYVSTRNVYEAQPEDHTDLADAVDAYITEQKKLIDRAANIKSLTKG